MGRGWLWKYMQKKRDCESPKKRWINRIENDTKIAVVREGEVGTEPLWRYKTRMADPVQLLKEKKNENNNNKTIFLFIKTMHVYYIFKIKNPYIIIFKVLSRRE